MQYVSCFVFGFFHSARRVQGSSPRTSPCCVASVRASSSGRGHLGCFQIRAPVNGTVVAVRVHRFVSEYVSSGIWGVHQGLGMIRSNFPRNPHTVSPIL